MKPTLFQAALGEAWHDLPQAVQRLHSVRSVERFCGRARVTRGRGFFPLVAAWLFQFPKEGDDVPLTLTKTRAATGEVWERSFAGRRLRSFLAPSDRPSHCRERFGPLACELGLSVEDAALHLPVRRGWFLGVPLPSWLLPVSCSREFAVDGGFHFDVGLYAPLTGGLVVRYRGWLEPEAEARTSEGAKP
jgi:hypothetical protein